MAQSKVLEFLQKRSLNIMFNFTAGEYATNVIIANVETLSQDDSNSHSFSSDGHEFWGLRICHCMSYHLPENTNYVPDTSPMKLVQETHKENCASFLRPILMKVHIIFVQTCADWSCVLFGARNIVYHPFDVIFYRAMHNSAKRGIAIACRPSVRL